ncbi:hypothetical protein V8E51_017672 [Hyaloscypha variabilis]
MALPCDACYILDLPREIRFIIYRLILIPHPSHYFLDPDIPNRTSHIDWWNSEPYKAQRPLHTAIFRTNRFINAEATSLLHRELTLIICPTDIAALRYLAEQLLDISEPLDSSFKVWRYDPRCLPPIQCAISTSPGPTYITKQLLGKMYPHHVFAQFQNIVLNLSLAFPTPCAESLPGEFKGFSVDYAGHNPSSELESLTADICSTTLIRDAVTLLSHSASLSILWITLDIHAKNREIWLECGVLDPLKELTNVECAILSVRCPTEGCFVTLQPRYAAIAERLEEDIESGGPMD